MKLNANPFFSLVDKSKIIVFICLSMLFLSCEKENKFAKTDYKSDFSKITQTTLPELEYASENSKEWQIINNKIECLVSNEDRKISLRTRQLGNQEGDLEMSVHMGFYNDEISNLNKNWAGFHIGSKSDFKVNAPNSKKGINIGMCTNGALFIGAPSPNHKNKTIIEALKKGVNLKMSISNHFNNYTIDLSVIDTTNGKVLGRISKKDIAKEQITGDLALISSFENIENENSNPTKSVWFQDWEIKGSKVTLLTK
ncbi:hypothetical protein H9I45_07795 [Polaribacter haliotis]|uniref:Uncharacterized protein n=1 Tax=Polaribacter haliotis TaxID=1888915 RepID=A0A7L8AK28_9FLAO|nr:hypothetical protein [Polaribacter haliotis]QOD62333.1 hypothetical protein H9I45_07795 [Polaribacter haliotis]